MKIRVLSQKVICSNRDSMNNYFAWPTVARMRDGRLVFAASGYRIAHVDPFGKCILSFSEDEGETWSAPQIVIDTMLDDRDGGVVPFGESGLLVTSFNNDFSLQRTYAKTRPEPLRKTIEAYLEMLEGREDVYRQLGSTFRFSFDNGKTFGELKTIPVSTPHGPTLLRDGSFLYVGRKFTSDCSYPEDEPDMAVYKLFTDGSYQYLCDIEDVGGRNSCEPYAFENDDGSIIVQIRIGPKEFTTYQCESYDSGRSFTTPHRILRDNGGAPTHIIKKDEMLISLYGYREKPYGIRAMFSRDNGKTWDTDYVITEGFPKSDMGYPTSVVLKDGNILTVFYSWADGYDSAVIHQVIWNYEE